MKALAEQIAELDEVEIYGRVVGVRAVRRLHRWVLQDLVKAFDCSCEGDERRAEWIRGGFARGHLLLASKRVGQGKQPGRGDYPVVIAYPSQTLFSRDDQ